MLKCRVEVGKIKIKKGCNWDVRLGRREGRGDMREEREGEGINEDSLGM